MKFLKDIHWPVFLLTISITGASFLFIYSATFRGSENYMYRQLFWFLLSLVGFWTVIGLGYRRFLNVAYFLYGCSLVALVTVLIVGEMRHGAQRWLEIGPFAFQPSEFAKFATILALAQFLTEESRKPNQKRSFALGALLALVPFFLIMKQPDLGSALIFVPLLFGMLFVWGVRFRYLMATMLAGALSFPVAWSMLKPYQQKRWLVFLNPNMDPLGSGYTAVQSKIAVGSGGLFGKGWLHGTQTQLDFVPEHHTDFIFCVVGEEFGFLGGLLLILLFASLIGYFLKIMEHTTDMRARLVAAGFTSVFFFQAAVNIGMVIGMAPITGLTLPLVSYGGSSLLATYLGIGLLVSVYRERSIF